MTNLADGHYISRDDERKCSFFLVIVEVYLKFWGYVFDQGKYV